MTHRRSLLLLPAMLLLAQCGGPSRPPAVLKLRITGANDQNPDAAGTPASVAVRIYQLRATRIFERSGWAPLTEREQATLGPADAGSQDVVVAPGQTVSATILLHRGVRAVGFVVLFRDIDHAHWRTLAPVAESGPTTVSLTIDKLSVSLASEEG